MKRLLLLAVILVAFVFTAPAQDVLKKDAAKPAEPEIKVVLDSWNEIGRKLTALAEDFPEDKYDFKPTPADGVSPSSCCTRRVPATTSRML